MRLLRRSWPWLLFALLSLAVSGGAAGLWAAPFFKPLTQSLLALQNNLAAYSGWRSATEIATLRERVARLEGQNRELDQTRRENERLRRVLGLRQNAFARAVTASVCGRGLSDWATHVIVDRGSSAGVGLETVAICDTGLVGRVSETARDSARVRFFTAPGAVVPAVLGQSGAVGILYGQGAQGCEMRFVDAQAKIKEGELVYTSGQGRTYPAGLCLGKVVRNRGKSEALYQTLDVTPASDFSALREVLLIDRDNAPVNVPHSLENLEDESHGKR